MEHRTDQPPSTLDQAYACWFSGDHDGALRSALVCLTHDPEAHGAIVLVAAGSLGAGREERVERVAAGAVRALALRGDLPAALLSLFCLRAAGASVTALVTELAADYGSDSPLLANVPQRPPALPSLRPVPEAPTDLDIEHQVTQVLDAYAKRVESLPTDQPRPRFALLSSMPAQSLVRFFERCSLRHVQPGDCAVREGEPGSEAYVVLRGALDVLRGEGGGDDGVEAEGSGVLAELGPGAVFGEMALLTAAPRTATVRASKASVMLCFSRDELEREASATPELSEQLVLFCRRRIEANLVNQAPVLSGVPRKQRYPLLRKLETRVVQAGEKLVEQGQQMDALYLIASGLVSVSILDDEGELLQVATLSHGNVVGEISMLLRQPSTADVVAVHPTVLLEMSRERLHKLIRYFPAMLVTLYEMATRRHEETRELSSSESLAPEDEELEVEDCELEAVTLV